MMYEVIYPKESSDLISFPGVISIPGKEIAQSNLFFVNDFNVTTIRPINTSKVSDSSELYINQIILELNKFKEKNLIFIDLKISDSIKNQIILNKFDFFSEKFISPLINNLKAAKIDFKLDDDILSCKQLVKINQVYKNIQSFQIIFPKQNYIMSLNNKKIDIKSIYEEMITFAYLTITEQL